MKNEEIILTERLALMRAGIIKTTGRKILIEDETGSEKEVFEPEEIHTYRGWQERHRQVRKGEKSVDSFRIWKHTTAKSKDEAEGEDLQEMHDRDHMFMTQAYFFTRDQTDEAGS